MPACEGLFNQSAIARADPLQVIGEGLLFQTRDQSILGRIGMSIAAQTKQVAILVHMEGSVTPSDDRKHFLARSRGWIGAARPLYDRMSRL